MKKRALSLLMAVLMVVGLLPATARAVGETENTTPTTVNVDFTAQAAGVFLIPPQFNVAVSSDEAENFGYKDNVTDGVSALDVLVKAHEFIYGADKVATKLEVNNGGIARIFGEKTYNCGFTINGEQPHNNILVDDTYAPGGKSYTGYNIAQAEVKNNDVLEFYIYQDSYALDNYPLYKQNGKNCSELSVKPGGDITLTLDGYCIGYYGCVPMQALEELGQIDTIEDAQFAWVAENEGVAEVTDIPNAISDENGAVTFTAPAAEGTYYLTAYMPADEISNNYATPLIMHLLKVTVDKNATTPDIPQTDPCALIDLIIKGYGANGYDQISLALTPTFAADTVSYISEERVFRSDFTQKLLAVSLTKADKNAVVKGKLNGENEKDFTQTENGSFNNMLPGQDNVLTITVTNGEQSKTYTVTIPMAADPAAPVLMGDKTAAATVKKGGSYTLDLTKVFKKGTSETELTYQVSVDGKTAVETNANYSYAADAAGVYKLVFTAKSGSLTSPTYTVTLNVQPETVLVMHNIAAKYAASGVAQDNNSYWLAADMMAYEKTFPDSANKLTHAQKQAMMELAVKTMETSTSAGDLAKSIIALTAMGYDATKITTDSGAALDGVAKLAAMVNDERNTNVTNIYTLPYVMIALQQFSNTYQAELDKLTNSALDQALKNGGWSWGPDFDADATNPVILALATYNNTNDKVRAALDKAMTALAAYQKKDGSVGNGASTGLAIAAVSALGMNPVVFVNADGGKSLVDGLLANALASEDGFDSNAHSFGTEQGFRGLIALANAKEGHPYRLYDFSGQTLVPAVATFWAQNAAVSVKTIPEDATVAVKSGETEVVADKDHGAYDLPAGTYTYTVSKNGYVTKTGSFTITAEQAAGHEKQTINVSLVAASSSGGSSKDIKVTVKVMVPPADQNKLYTYKHNAKVYTNLVSDDKNAVTVSSGTSVRDAVVSVLDLNNISYYEKSDGYFPTIGGWEETERGKNSGWMFMVNGSMSTVSAKDYDLTRNSTIVWFYTDDYTNDYGSESWSDGGSSSKPEENQTFPFLDVVDTSWYYAAVKYAYEHKLFGGTSATEFSPEATMTRGMAATILYSLEGSPAVSAKSPFSDVADGQWYAKAVTWAEEKGIVGGIDSESFAPEAGVTREQLAAILYRYAQYKKYSVSVGEDTNILSYEDALQISPYAVSAIQWACGSGLMTGRTQTALAPVGTVTRAEVAVMLQRFCEKNIK